MAESRSHFVTNVKSMYELQDQLKATAVVAKVARDPIKQELDTVQEEIKTYMTESKVYVCNYHEKRLELQTVTRYGSLTKKSLSAALAEYFQDETKAVQCYDHVVAFIGSKEVTILKSLKNRKRKDTEEEECGEAAVTETDIEPPELDEDSD